MTTLLEGLVPDKLWAMVAPLLPASSRPPYDGRRRTIPDRNCFAAVVFMARTSTPWRLLPTQELGCGSAATVWRRLNQWARAGVFEALHLEMTGPRSIKGSETLSKSLGSSARCAATRPPGWPSVQPVVPDVHSAGHVSAICAPTPCHRLRGAHGQRPRTGQALLHPSVRLAVQRLRA